MNKIAVLQMVSVASVEKNLQELAYYFAEAERQGVEVLILPENFAFMGKDEKDKCQIAEEEGTGIIQETIASLARQCNMWVIAGTIPIRSPQKDKVYARCIVYNNDGERVSYYDKIHLFDVMVSEKESHCESSSIVPGKRCVVVDTPVGRVGLSVCYDLRFAELYRYLVEQGAEILVVPSAFTAVTGAAHWETLLRARAIENLSYVLAANQGGCHESGRLTYGHSMIIEPWGTIQNELKQGAGLVTGHIHLESLRKVRQQFPCLEHHVLFPKKVEV